MNDTRPLPPGNTLFTRHPSNPVVTTHDLPYAANAIFNAAAARVDGLTILLARVEDLRGLSHLTVLRSVDGILNWKADPEPTLVPLPGHYPEEHWGIEDPRATWMEDLRKWAIVYTAYSRRGPLVSLALTEDFRTFERMGAILSPDDKNSALFPRKFGGRWAILHRPMAQHQDANIWLSFSSDLKQWGDHVQVLESRRGAWWDSHRIGTCPPPMETPYGWLLLYHGVRQTVDGAIYRLGLALLDREDPRVVLRRSDDWILSPKEPYERIGDVGNVVFSCGWLFDEPSGEIRLYYGAADTCIAVATARMDEVLDYILACPRPE